MGTLSFWRDWYCLSFNEDIDEDRLDAEGLVAYDGVLLMTEVMKSYFDIKWIVLVFWVVHYCAFSFGLGGVTKAPDADVFDKGVHGVDENQDEETRAK